MINVKIFTNMMDEQLIDEVAQHGVIFNRQKYYLNGSSAGGKYETKDEAWQVIAMKLHTDVETCKKRWKYLRERYVSQRKQGDPPVYEHLSRPYLEKMKFLDQHIQPRKSYRNVTNFLTSPHSANSSYSEYNMDSKSNNSMKNMAHFGNVSQHSYQQQDPQHAMNALSSAAAAALESANGPVKIEADQVFRDFAAAVASQQLQHISQSQMQHQQAAAVAAAMADSSQNFTQQFRDGVDTSASLAQNAAISTGGITSSSSSLKSPLSSPIAAVNGNASTTHSTSAPQQVAAHSSSATHTSPVAPSTSSNNGSNNNQNQNNNQQLPAHGYNDSNNDDLDSSTSSNYHMKKPRVALGGTLTNGTNHQQQTNTNGVNNNHNSHAHSHFVDDTDDDSDENSGNMLQLQAPTLLQQDNHFNNSMGVQRTPLNANSMGNNSNHMGNQQQAQGMFTSNADFLFQLYQQLPTQASTSQQTNFNKFQTPQNPLPLPQRSSEHLLGELVTTELLKMSKERRKNVQKRILEILFFDD